MVGRRCVAKFKHSARQVVRLRRHRPTSARPLKELRGHQPAESHATLDDRRSLVPHRRDYRPHSYVGHAAVKRAIPSVKCRDRSRCIICAMAKLRVPREQVEKMLAERIRAGKDLAAKTEVTEKTGGYRDWLHLFATWRDHTIAELKAAYEGKDIALEFELMTDTTERSSPQFTFEYRKSAVSQGIWKLEGLIERLQLTLPDSQDAAGIKTLHPEVYSRCRTLYEGGEYAVAVERGFKVVRDRLRSLTNFETGSEAFGKGKLYVKGAAAPHVDDDFQEGVKFLTMAIDRFRNEKAHTADGNISEPIRAYEYLRISSLAMHLLEKAVVP